MSEITTSTTNDLIEIEFKFDLKENSRKYLCPINISINQIEQLILSKFTLSEDNTSHKYELFDEALKNSPKNNNFSLTLSLDKILENYLMENIRKLENRIDINDNRSNIQIASNYNHQNGCSILSGKMNVSHAENFELIQSKEKKIFESIQSIDYDKVVMKKANLDELEQNTLSKFETKVMINGNSFILFSPDILEQHNLNYVLELNHPHIQKVFGTTKNRNKTEYSLILHNINAYTLEDKITRAIFEKSLNDEKKWLIVYEISELLDYLNKNNILYVNLNPKNILIDYNGKVYLKFNGFFNLEDTVYSAPEIINKTLLKTSLLRQSNYDTYSLGCIIYFIFTGIHPYNGDLNFYKENIKNNVSFLDLQTVSNDLYLLRLIKSCSSLESYNRITPLRAKIYVILNNQNIFLGFIESIYEQQNLVSTKASCISQVKDNQNLSPKKSTHKVFFNTKIEVYEITHEKYRRNHFFNVEDNKNIKLEIKDLKFKKQVITCSKCSSKNSNNKCQTCTLKYCNDCMVRCKECDIIQCLNCCKKLDECLNCCNNNICNSCISQIKATSSINKSFYLGNICKELHCKECVEIQYCKVCEDFCCLKCLKFCAYCSQIICLKCHQSYMNNKDNMSYKTVRCSHNLNILIGCNKGKVVKYDIFNKNILTEYNLHESGIHNHITSLLRINEKFVTTSYDGEVKIWKDIGLDSKVLEFDNEESRISQAIVVNNDKIALAGWNNRTAMLIDLNSDEEEITKELVVDSMLTSICSYDNDVVLLGGYDKSIIYFWDFVKNKIVYQMIGHKHCVNNIVKLKASDNYVTTGEDENINIWDSSLKKPLILSNTDIVQNYVCEVKENHDGRVMFSSKDYQIKLYDLKSNSFTCLKQHTNFVYDYLPLDDYNFLSISKDYTIVMWDLRKNKVIDLYKFDGFYPVRMLNYYDV